MLYFFWIKSGGQGGWPDRIFLPHRADLSANEIEIISAINYVSSNLIYLGTNFGGLYYLTKDKGWEIKAIHNRQFPKRYVSDVATMPNDQKTVIVVLSGFGTPHVWKGVNVDSGNVEWMDISPRTDIGKLLNIPFNAIVIDDNKPDTMYVGTDLGVLYTIDGGKNWTVFNEGLPHCQVYDMRLSRSGLLRIATHGRGMWQRKINDK